MKQHFTQPISHKFNYNLYLLNYISLIKKQNNKFINKNLSIQNELMKILNRTYI